mmetsp:Transcript_17558/g.43203  ORF Transcript_17558/g.43203 Transcript_17558/m.43203 type:complete len:206 (-) Transcript_17558:1034-1651(-)
MILCCSRNEGINRSRSLSIISRYDVLNRFRRLKLTLFSVSVSEMLLFRLEVVFLLVSLSALERRWFLNQCDILSLAVSSSTSNHPRSSSHFRNRPLDSCIMLIIRSEIPAFSNRLEAPSYRGCHIFTKCSARMFPVCDRTFVPLPNKTSKRWGSTILGFAPPNSASSVSCACRIWSHSSCHVNGKSPCTRRKGESSGIVMPYVCS